MIGLTDLVGGNWLATGRAKQAYKDICETHNLVYFGSVDQQRDEHELIRGVTLSPSHRDAHYCVGSINGYDVIFCERTDSVSFPRKPTRDYRWNILQVDLRNVNLPHVLLDAGHHDETFYSQLFTKFIRLSKADRGIFADHDPIFTNRFTAYAPPDSLETLPLLFSTDTTTILGHHFSHFDYECYQDRLIVYTPNRLATKQTLEHMIKAGLWLANELENNATNAHAV